MKNLKNIFLALLTLISTFSIAQTLVEIPTPVGYTNPNRGCRGDMLVYQNQLLLLYEKNDYARVLHKFDGTNLTEIPSPEGFEGAYGGYNNFGEFNSPTIANGKLYMFYDENELGTHSHLFSYDGTALTQIPTPPEYLLENNGSSGGLGAYLRTLGSNFIGSYFASYYDGDLFKYDGNQLTLYPTPSSHRGSRGYTPDPPFPPTIVGNNIFLRYLQNNNNFDLFKFDGTTLTEIPSPIGFENAYVGLRGLPYVFGDALYLQYVTNDNSNKLGKYENNTLTIIPSPENYNGNSQQGINRGYAGSAIAVDSMLYLKYLSDSNSRTLFKYDGATLTEIPTPPDYSGYRGDPFVYNNTLYLGYLSTLSNTIELVKYDGTNFTPILPQGELDGDRYFGDPVVVGETLYLRYKAGSYYYLSKFDGTTLTGIPTPPNYQNSNRGYIDLPFVVGSNIFMRYQHNNGSYVLFKYDGTTLTEIPSPPGYNNNERGYHGSPTYYNGNLYFRYRSNTGQYVLFKYEDSSLNIEEHVNDKELFMVYPNPAKDYLTVHYEANQKQNITVYSSLGKLLATYKNAENNFQVPVAQLANGLYFIAVQDESGKTATLKFVKNN